MNKFVDTYFRIPPTNHFHSAPLQDLKWSSPYSWLATRSFIINRVALAKQGDNVLGSVRPSVRPSVRQCELLHSGQY